MSTLHFSTDDYQESDRIAAWREIFGSTIAKLDMEPIGDQPFRGKALVHALPNLTIGSISSTPNRIMRTPALIADGSDDIMLGIMLKGSAVVAQNGHEAVTLGCGDAVVWSNATVGHSHYPEAIDFLAVAIPRNILVPQLADPERATFSLIPRQSQVLPLLTHYVQTLQQGQTSQPLDALAATHVLDLVTMALGPTRDAAQDALHGGVGAARLQAIKADIIANITRPNLNIATLARRHGISPRSIRALFSRVQTTFTDFVLEQRLARAHRVIVDPLYIHETISSIALGAGFGDISYFNMTFRRRYGATPTEVRRASQASESDR